MQQDAKEERGKASAGLLALSIALGHPAVATDPQNVCTLARVCRAWRAAVQQSGACHTSITVKPAAGLLTLASLASWLPQHAGLVHSITIDTSCFSVVDGLLAEKHQALAQQLLQQSLQLAATPAPAAPGTQPLRLQRFSSNYLGIPAIISALPSSYLTHLQLHLAKAGHINGPALAAALAPLTSLVDLKLATGYSKTLPGTCLAAVGELSRLTSLAIDAMITGSAVQQLEQLVKQTQLQHLQKLHLDLGGSYASPQLDMSGLTSLTDLSLVASSSGFQEQGSALPLQLKRVHVGGDDERPLSSLRITALQQLQQLSLNVNCDKDELQPLVHMTWLQQLSLTYAGVPAWRAADTAPLWGRLPALAQLEMDFDESANQDDFVMIMSGLSAASSLTKLELDVCLQELEEFEQYDGEVCSLLKGLTQLQDLAINSSISKMASRDALHLTALTALTRLQLSDAGSAVGDVAATALACHLTQLRSLWLDGCALGYCACLPAIGRLTGLTELFLNGNIEEEGLMLLTGLTNLSTLCVDGAGIAAATVERLWAAIRRQQPQQLQQQ